MGHTRKDLHDPDNEFITEDFLDSDEIEDDLQNPDAFALDVSGLDAFGKKDESARFPKAKSKRKKARVLRKTIAQESDDWIDPEDDIMYGFEE